MARRTRVNVLRRDQLLRRFLADYQPTTTLRHWLCETLAGIAEQGESAKPGSPEHQRLVQLAQQIGEALESSRGRASPTALDGLSTEELIAETTTLLHQLLDLRDQEQQPSAPPAEAPARTAHAQDAAAAISPEPPPPFCAYCRRVCVGRDHHAYDVLHWDDPEHVDARRQRETAEMWESLRCAGTGEIPQW